MVMIVTITFMIALVLGELVRRQWVRLHTFRITKRKELPPDPERERVIDLPIDKRASALTPDRAYRHDDRLMLRPK
jgi:hypothetical protein